ncbi:hypothetical protein LR48_Vigan406s025200 [Vigna angularis]|uniref:Uncharacterized protein n=1 Tax=Phaseolus angularis TaxID=3914 RepID=A0A0L9TAA1_PHAAN|nr:hypothetical protein LR48_Vigan406s025200 [Vigna angularis]
MFLAMMKILRLEMEASPSQMPHLTKVVDVNLADGTVEKGKDEIPVPSPPIPEVATLLHSLQDASKGIVISSGKKRKGVEVLVNEDNIDKIGRIDRSPEVHTRGNGDVQLEQTYYLRREKEKLGDQTWNDEDLIQKEGEEAITAVLIGGGNLRRRAGTRSGSGGNGDSCGGAWRRVRAPIAAIFVRRWSPGRDASDGVVTGRFWCSGDGGGGDGGDGSGGDATTAAVMGAGDRGVDWNYSCALDTI